jgi:hypothetical protein
MFYPQKTLTKKKLINDRICLILSRYFGLPGLSKSKNKKTGVSEHQKFGETYQNFTDNKV